VIGFILWFLVSISFIALPFVLPAFTAIEFSGSTQMILMIVGIASLLALVILVVITKLYQKTSANEALVRTGMGGKKVVLDGGILYIPVLHKILRINLETMRLDVKRDGKDALITSDSLRANVASQFYIKVKAEGTDVTNASRSLGEKSITPNAVKELVFEKLVSALRTVAAKSTLFELNSERERFSEDVKVQVEKELKHNGLTLESVTISELDQADVSQMRKNNVFDANGLKRVAEITQAALADTNALERDAEKQIAAKDVETRKRVLSLELEQRQAEAEQRRDVANAQAESDREAAEFKIEQDQKVAERDVEKVRAVKAAQIDADKQLVQTEREKELTEVEKAKAIETANREKQAAIIKAEEKKQVADVQREKAVEVASRAQQIAIAQKEEERAKAEAQRLSAEAERETEAQGVKTVEEVKTAERDKQKQVIRAQAEAETRFVEKQRDADAKAYELKALAEGKKEAADADAFAKTRAAEADKEAAEKRALGEQAEQMVPVNVAQKQVEVERAKAKIEVDVAEKQVAVDRQAVEVQDARVAVERKDLENREKFGRAALEFELDKVRIAKSAEVSIETAKAMATFLHKADITIFGDPDTMASMTDKFIGSMGMSTGLEGFFAGLKNDGNGNGDAKALVDKVVKSATGLVDGLADFLKKERGMKPKEAKEMAQQIAGHLQGELTPPTPVVDASASPADPPKH